jgi:hypothetical protein
MPADQRKLLNARGIVYLVAAIVVVVAYVLSHMG